MAIALTGDPIVTLQECKDVLGMNDEQQTIVLINSVSQKFRKYTNRVQINKSAVEELTRAIDGVLVWSHASPIDPAEDVLIELKDPNGIVTESYSVQAGELVVDWERGRIARSGCIPFPSFCGCGSAVAGIPSPEQSFHRGGSTFPTLHLSYSGGWEPVPGDVMLGAFEQIRMDLERLKGNIGLLAGSNYNDAQALNNEGLLESVENTWKRYRVMI